MRDIEKNGENGRFERSPVTQMLLDRLVVLKPGEMVEYEELDAIALDRVQVGAKGLLYGARETARKEGVATVALANQGIKRLTDAETADEGLRRVRNLHKGAGRTMSLIVTVQDPSKLDPAQRRKLEVAQLQSGIIRQFSSARFRSHALKLAALPPPKTWKYEMLKPFGKSRQEAEVAVDAEE